MTYECPFCGKKGIAKLDDKYQTEKLETMKTHVLRHHSFGFIYSQFEPDIWDSDLTGRDWNVPVKCRHCGDMVEQGCLLRHLIERDHEKAAFEELKVKDEIPGTPITSTVDSK
jgi:hypothetical protein